MTNTSATLLWLRRDLRLGDHPGWERALAGEGPVTPVFILDPVIEDSYGAAPRWRLERALERFSEALKVKGSRLILRRGRALDVLEALIEETGARRVVWSRQYEAAARTRDSEIKGALKERGLEVHSVNAALLFEPWTVETKTGGYYKVYTPFWKAVRGSDPGGVLAAPSDLKPPKDWPVSDTLADWGLGKGVARGARHLTRHAIVGEDAALARLDWFLDGPIARYKAERDRMDLDATSKLGQCLATGEVSPRTLWHAGRQAMEQGGRAAEGAETFVQEIVWREFAYHLLYHTPQIAERNWREEWDAFPWQDDNDGARRWQRGLTGIAIVDAAMREMYVSGTMHNRARMLTASLLTKHLMTHWRLGERWFAEHLIDWDPASNAMGWQWSAGSGPDATPFFRIFNPETQAEKFDPQKSYRSRWLAEGRQNPHEDALAYFDAVPRAWGLEAKAPYPKPIVDLKQGRERALAAYKQARSAA
ncbi:MAG: deoxyribodipyrimidine photo-lyase [Pseudomonadota bacterium]